MNVSVLTPMQSKKNTGCGCLSGGCAMAFAIALLLFGALGWGAWSTYTGLRSMTSESPRPVAVFNATPEQYQQVAAKLKSFEETYNAGRDAGITLSADEINTLIARHPDWSLLKGHVFVTMNGTRLEAQIGAPLSQIRTFENRHFNGEASMAFVVEKGQPRPVSVSVKANDTEFPSWLIRYLTSMDFVQSLELPGMSKADGVLTHLLTVEVKDSLLIIHARK